MGETQMANAMVQGTVKVCIKDKYQSVGWLSASAVIFLAVATGMGETPHRTPQKERERDSEIKRIDLIQ